MIYLTIMSANKHKTTQKLAYYCAWFLQDELKDYFELLRVFVQSQSKMPQKQNVSFNQKRIVNCAYRVLLDFPYDFRLYYL